jgi:uncharacterized protein YdiU (UPF0061 family)
MPTDAHYRPAARYPDAVGDGLYDVVRAASFPEHRLRFRNDAAAASLGLAGLDDAEWLDAFGRFRPLPGNLKRPLALRYHGHQFRHYNPDLGDGRGFLFAQLEERGTGRLLDLTTKGTGTTPWSRGGDGRLTLQGAVREVLAAEMLESLGVRTCRILSVVETGEQLQRHDEPSPTRAAAMVRVQHSSVRFGTFQRLAYFRDEASMRRLVEWCTTVLYPELAEAADRPAALLAAARAAAAETLGGWLAAGFVHGVLNTDNLNITGESFDYGPYRFLPWLDPGFTAAYFDHSGLYAFGRQSSAVWWNLQQLAHALSLVGDRATLARALDGFERETQAALRTRFLHRLGVVPDTEMRDHELLDTAAQVLQAGKLPYDRFFFDWYGGGAAASRADTGRFGRLYRSSWFAPLRARLADRAPARPDVLSDPYFEGDDPVAMVDDVTVGTWAPIARDDDWSAFDALVGRVRALGVRLGNRPG